VPAELCEPPLAGYAIVKESNLPRKVCSSHGGRTRDRHVEASLRVHRLRLCQAAQEHLQERQARSAQILRDEAKASARPRSLGGGIVEQGGAPEITQLDTQICGVAVLDRDILIHPLLGT